MKWRSSLAESILSCSLMAKTKATEEMDRLQGNLRPFLKEHGFRVKARTANRATSDGLTHVINFQMGRFDPPGTSYIPWFRQNLYGKFTVNVGVYVPEVAILRYGSKERSFAAEVECCVRMRLAQLGGEKADRWWNLPGDQRAETDLRRRFENDAFPFLARLRNRDLLLQEFESNPVIGGPGSRITSAIILAARGLTEPARSLLSAQIRASRSIDHIEYVRRLAEQIGLGRIDV
jgi:hypothetical protein